MLCAHWWKKRRCSRGGLASRSAGRPSAPSHPRTRSSNSDLPALKIRDMCQFSVKFIASVPSRFLMTLQIRWSAMTTVLDAQQTHFQVSSRGRDGNIPSCKVEATFIKARFFSRVSRGVCKVA